MERVDTIAQVGTKQLPTGVTIYLLTDSEGREYSTRNRDLARVGNEAWTNGQHVKLDYDEKKGGQFGQFTNRYLNDLVLVQDGTPTQFAGNSPGDQPAGLFDDAEPPIGRVIANPEAERNEMIAKQVALKAGVEVLQYLPAEERTVANVITAAEYFTTWLTSWRP